MARVQSLAGNSINPNIFINRFGEMYKAAGTGDPCALKVLAAAIAHEIKHTDTKDEVPPSRVELEVLDGFIRDSQVSLREQVCLMERQQTVKRRVGMK